MVKSLPFQVHPDLLVGLEAPDDAGVYRLTPELALIQTVDFFTPIVNDPYQFGAIAAANAMSDVYAMGCRPLTALNIACFPLKTTPVDTLKAILRGGLDKVHEAGALLVGGHSVEDPELKYGLAVTGVVHPDKILTKGGALPGDRLILTKPLGTGIIATALKGRLASAAAEAAMIRVMSELNRAAAEALADLEVHAVTDITGFGLLGHAREMDGGSKVSLVIDSTKVEFLPEAVEYSRGGCLPGGLKRNMEFIGSCVEFVSSSPEEVRNLLFDPQTSGGLLFSVAAQDSPKLVEALRALPIPARAIGEVIEKTHPLIQVR